MTQPAVYEVHKCEMLYALPEQEFLANFSESERVVGADLFIEIFSRTRGEGKTTLWRAVQDTAPVRWGKEFRFLPEAKNRRRREAVGNLPAEKYGVDLVYYPQKRIEWAIREKKMLLAYKVETFTEGSGKEELESQGYSYGGLTVRAVKRAIRSNIEHFMTIPPAACTAFMHYFPLTRQIYILAADEQLEKNRQKRDLNPNIIPYGWREYYDDLGSKLYEVINDGPWGRMVAQAEDILRVRRMHEFWQPGAEIPRILEMLNKPR